MRFRTVKFESLSSTNDQAMRGDYAHGDLIITDHQTAGRGQRGNKWNSTPGENLMFSLVVEPTHIPVYEQFRISEITALATSDAIRSFGVDGLVKWPNDLYVSDLKICGILIEHVSMGEYLCKSVLGVGVNVRQTVFDPAIPNPTSLALQGVTCSVMNVLERFEEAFAWRYAQSAHELHHDFMARLWRRTGFHAYRDAEGIFDAQILDVEPLTGQLTLRDRAGRHRHYWFKEVEAVLELLLSGKTFP